MKTIKCGLLPGESQAVVRRLNEPLRAYLERSLGRAVELVVGSSYVATGEALRSGYLDLAYPRPGHLYPAKPQGRFGTVCQADPRRQRRAHFPGGDHRARR